MNRYEFLKQLYEYSDGKIELRALPSKKRTFLSLDNLRGIDAFCAKHANENLYFSIATRDGGGTKSHIQHIPAAWVDLDFKNIPQPHADKLIGECLGQPTFVVESGNGYHVYWKFKEPWGKSNIADHEKLLRQLAVYFSGDLAATDSSRILRLPDSRNFKYKPPRRVKVLFASKHEYDLSDFDFLADAATLANDPHGSEHINSTHTLYKGATSESATCPQHGATKRNISFCEGSRDETLFRIANHLVKGNMPRQEIEIILQFIASKCDPPFPKNEVAAKIKSALKRTQAREKGLTERIRDHVSATWGNFSATSVYKAQQIATSDRGKARVILCRLVKEGIIERDPNRDGWFRRVENVAEDIDFLNAETKTFNIKWPFQIEKLVEIMPGNIIILAGEVESGKTAVLLNVARLNLHKHAVYYFSSEMGASELRKRLTNFDHMTLNQWKSLKAKSRSGDFHDVIAPNALNIIDFIEVHDEFYKIGAYLKKIHDKLDKGVAVVALQKPPGRDEGLGGQRSMEVARLYLSLSKEYPGGRLKIVKGKNWATDRNPNGLSVKYKILKGCQLIQQGDWVRQ